MLAAVHTEEVPGTAMASLGVVFDVAAGASACLSPDACSFGEDGGGASLLLEEMKGETILGTPSDSASLCASRRSEVAADPDGVENDIDDGGVVVVVVGWHFGWPFCLSPFVSVWCEGRTAPCTANGAARGAVEPVAVREEEGGGTIW